MERNTVVIEKKSFKCDVCGVYNKVGAYKCWKCGKFFDADRALEEQLQAHTRTVQEDIGKEHKTLISRVITLLLFIVPPAGIVLTWLKQDWAFRSKIVGTAASVVWSAIICLTVLVSTEVIELPYVNPPLSQAPASTASRTGGTSQGSEQGSQGHPIDSQQLSVGDALRRRINNSLGEKNAAGLDRVVGVIETYCAINADGDPLAPDHRALREQLLTVMPAISYTYHEMDVYEPFKAVLYLVGKGTHNVSVELDALTVYIDADTVRDTDWSAVEADWLGEYAEVEERVLTQD